MGKQAAGRAKHSMRVKARRAALFAVVLILTVTVCVGGAAATPVGGSTITVNGSGSIVVSLSGANIVVTLSGGTVVNMALSGLNALVINGGVGSDDFTLDFSGGFFTLPGGITFNGFGGATDSLKLIGAGLTASQMTYTPGGTDATGHSGTYSVGFGMQQLTVNFTGLEPIDDQVPATNYTINVSSTTSTLSLTTASGWYVADFAGAAENVRFRNKTNVGIDMAAAPAGVALTMNVPAVLTGDPLAQLVINGSVDDTYTLTATPAVVNMIIYGLAGNDTFNVGGGVANSIAGPLTLNGGPGSDTFNLGQGTAQVFASSLLATGVSGDDTFNVGQGLLDHSFTSFELSGGDGTDSVVFDDNAATTETNDTLYAGQLTHSGIVPFMYGGMEALSYIGGSAADNLHVVDTHAGTTTIEGRGGDENVRLDDCSGNVSMVGGAGTHDWLTIPATGLAPASWTFAGTLLTSSLFTSTVSVDDATTEVFAITGGPGADTFVVTSAPVYTELYLYGAGPTFLMAPPWDSVDCPGALDPLGDYYGEFTAPGRATVTYEAVEVTPVPLVVPTASATTVDEGQSVSFTGTVYDSDSTTFTFAWDFGDGSTSTEQSPTHTYVQNGSYTVTFTATDGDTNSGTDTLGMTVANVAPTVDAGPDQSANPGEVVTFDGSFTDPGTADTHTITWTFGDGGTATGTLTPTHTYASAGTYTVTLTVTDNFGGFDSDTLTVEVADARSVRRQATDLLVAQLSHLTAMQARLHTFEQQALRLLNAGSSQFTDGLHLRETTGATLFANDKQAIRLLLGAIASGRLDATIGAQVIALLLESDRLLAEQAIAEANAAHGNAALIAQAAAQLAAGDVFAAQNQPDLAVEAYGAAWGFAVRAY